MIDPESLKPTEQSDPNGPTPPGSSPPQRFPEAFLSDPPTVRSASAPGASPVANASLRAAAGLPPVLGGSSVQRSEILPAGASSPLEIVLPLPLPSLGERIDMFVIEAAIGVGGMGAVFRALDTRLDRHVALKILPPEQARDPEVVQRFYQEGRAAARLDHENIARVFTIGNDGRYHHIAFEYIEGTTVRQRVEKNGPLPVSEAINFTLQIADALVHAAEREVVHRDIKPSNIIVTPHGRAKLVDMGLARRFERGGDDGLTQSGMTLGTFDYISPEQARDPRDVDVRSDLYSLGCTLFHMLTGRPPFPEGTVLQKLIQHQEEAPPDVRSLNPSVTSDLANILVKLMAKDRDRRYQTPEQLVRDLLTVAGALGLRSVSPEGLVWLSSEPPPSWEKHLVWGIPVLVFTMIVAALVWWSRDPSPSPSSSLPNSIADQPPKVKVEPPPIVVTPSPTPRSSAPGLPATPTNSEPISAELTLTPAPEFTVEPDDNLLDVIASAPPRSVILLTNDGPYTLGGTRNDRPSPDRLVNRDLTIKADAGTRPILRLTRVLPLEGKPPEALFDLVGGHVVLEGLEFDLGSAQLAEPLTAVRTEDTDLTIRRCVFRQPEESPSPNVNQTTRVAALFIRNSPSKTGDRPPPLTIEQSHFEGGLVGIRAKGPAELLVRDSTFAGTDSAIWLDNPRAPVAVNAELRLRHLSIISGNSPVFRLEGADTRVAFADSVVAPSVDKEFTLVATNLRDGLAWQGRGNLFSHVGTFLQPTTAQTGGKPIRDFAVWTDDDLREVGSTLSQELVWDDPDPLKSLAKGSKNPTRAFQLASRHPGNADVGVRQGPFGSLSPALSIAANTVPIAKQEPPRPVPQPTPSPGKTSRSNPPTADRASADPPHPKPGKDESGPARAESSPKTNNPSTPEAANPPVSSDRPSKMNDLPLMPVMPPTAAGTVEESDKEQSAQNASPPSPKASEAGVSTAVASVETQPPPLPDPASTSPREPADRRILRTVEQLLKALAEPSARGGLLRVAADADWELPTITIKATGAWRIQAEPGSTRPRFRFTPAPADPKSPTAWISMIELRSGSLQLEGIDIVLTRENAPRQGRWAAFSVWPATDLSLEACTVTVEGNQTVSSVVAVESGENKAEEGVAAHEPPAATVRVHDTLIRTGDDFVDVGAERRLVLEMDNAVAATEGSLVHAHGIPRGQVAERLSLTLRQVSARLAGGLVHLQSAPGDPELPVADINARYSILATSSPKDAPLIRVDGQDAPASLRDRIVWEGLGVAYHLIATYRRDQSSQVGSVPTLFDRPNWVVAVGTREQSALHVDARLRREWNPDRPLWTIDSDDFRLDKDSPARASGAALDRIPTPPPVSS